MTSSPDNRNDLQARRHNARRTAAWLAAIALGVFIGFLVLGAMGR